MKMCLTNHTVWIKWRDPKRRSQPGAYLEIKDARESFPFVVEPVVYLNDIEFVGLITMSQGIQSSIDKLYELWIVIFFWV